MTDAEHSAKEIAFLMETWAEKGSGKLHFAGESIWTWTGEWQSLPKVNNVIFMWVRSMKPSCRGLHISITPIKYLCDITHFKSYFIFSLAKINS